MFGNSNSGLFSGVKYPTSHDARTFLEPPPTCADSGIVCPSDTDSANTERKTANCAEFGDGCTAANCCRRCFVYFLVIINNVSGFVPAIQTARCFFVNNNNAPDMTLTPFQNFLRVWGMALFVLVTLRVQTQKLKLRTVPMSAVAPLLIAAVSVFYFLCC